MSPESSRLGWRSYLGSQLQSARYSLCYYIKTSTSPHLHPHLICPPDLLTTAQKFSQSLFEIDAQIPETIIDNRTLTKPQF